jgi:hypothetical protein
METERRDVRGQDGGRLCGEDKYKYMRLVHAACGETRLLVYYWLASEEHPNIHNGKMT